MVGTCLPLFTQLTSSVKLIGHVQRGALSASASSSPVPHCVIEARCSLMAWQVIRYEITKRCQNMAQHSRQLFRASTSNELSCMMTSGGDSDGQVVMRMALYSARIAEQVMQVTEDAARPNVAASSIAASWRTPHQHPAQECADLPAEATARGHSRRTAASKQEEPKMMSCVLMIIVLTRSADMWTAK